MNALDYPCRIWSPVEGRLHVVFRYRPYNRAWLADHGIRAEWDSTRKRWYVSRSKLNVIIRALLEDFPEVLLIRDGLRSQRCDARCQAAKGADCVCGCAGAFHGSNAGSTVPVTEPSQIDMGDEINRSWTVLTR